MTKPLPNSLWNDLPLRVEHDSSGPKGEVVVDSRVLVIHKAEDPRYLPRRYRINILDGIQIQLGEDPWLQIANFTAMFLMFHAVKHNTYLFGVGALRQIGKKKGDPMLLNALQHLQVPISKLWDPSTWVHRCLGPAADWERDYTKHVVEAICAYSIAEATGAIHASRHSNLKPRQN